MRLARIVTLIMVALLALSGCESLARTTADQPSGPRTVVAQGGRIAVVDAAGKTAFVTSGPGDLVPAASPDGSTIAFTRMGPAETGGTYVVKTDGTGEKKVAPVVAALSQPAWSPDGSSLAIRDTTDKGRGVWVVNADGSDLQRVFEGNCGTPVWTPDGKALAVTELQKLPDLKLELGIYRVDLSTKDKTLITAGMYGAIAWSPDGKSLVAVTANKEGFPTDLVLVNATDGKTTALAGGVADGTWAPTWAPDGKLVAAVIGKEGEQQLVAMSPSGTEAKVLTKGDSIGTPVWAVDGKSLTTSMKATGSKQSNVVRVAADGVQPLKTVASGDSPSNLAGTVAPPKEVVAKAQMDGIRRAELKFVKGSWNWGGWSTAIEKAVVSQPGVLDVEFVWPSTYCTVIYDSSKIKVEDILAVSKDKAKRELAIINDQEFKQ